MTLVSSETTINYEEVKRQAGNTRKYLAVVFSNRAAETRGFETIGSKISDQGVAHVPT